MYTLRPYQKNAVESALKYFRVKKDPALIILPTGAGKSLVIAELSKIAKGRVLVLAHVKELVLQNYEKYKSFGLEAGIFSASLNQKDWSDKVIFGSIQSIARAPKQFFTNFSLLIIDECHRVDDDGDTQYQEVIKNLQMHNPDLCILGLTATPYRLGHGWLYEYSYKGEVKSTIPKFFKMCIYELPLSYMIENKYLTPPIKVDLPVTSYDFSSLTEKNRFYTTGEVEELLKNQKRLTPLIVNNIVDITEKFNRKGVMIFSGSIRHAEEILSYLPQKESAIVLGDTEQKEREEIIFKFKEKKIKYLVNVSVLTTGFDAPHVDVIAIMRPTESNGLYQQIVGRGLRLSEGKKDCLILDYTGMGHDLYRPEIKDKKISSDSVPVEIECPMCNFINHFWGIKDSDGEVIEHFGRKCMGGIVSDKTMKITPCTYKFRFKLCPSCSYENDISARSCSKCHSILIDADSKLKQAKLSKNAHILTPDRIEYFTKKDKNNHSYLEIRYYDLDGQYLSEAHFFNSESGRMKFNINFMRFHLRRPERLFKFDTADELVKNKNLLRSPKFVIARKQDKFWKITEKVFVEEL